VDVLPAPDVPSGQPVEPGRLHDLLEFVLASYDWVIADGPGIFEKLSLLALTDSDGAYVVTTSELPSLHLTRKAATFLLQVGFGPERFRVLVNRVNRKDGINAEDMSKIFNAPVHAAFPNDYTSLHQALAEGRAVSPPCAIGKAMEEFATQIAGQGAPARGRG
jgi:pilus assembly protein CpaE